MVVCVVTVDDTLKSVQLNSGLRLVFGQSKSDLADSILTELSLQLWEVVDERFWNLWRTEDEVVRAEKIEEQWVEGGLVYENLFFLGSFDFSIHPKCIWQNVSLICRRVNEATIHMQFDHLVRRAEFRGFSHREI